MSTQLEKKTQDFEAIQVKIVRIEMDFNSRPRLKIEKESEIKKVNKGMNRRV